MSDKERIAWCMAMIESMQAELDLRAERIKYLEDLRTEDRAEYLARLQTLESDMLRLKLQRA